ncbi:MAG: ribose-5-phosphate isomerase RpiA [Silvibacterium sp.]|nr:ribose-5-phosphate isomerase RpiA [Silvibacterium sp.]
METTVDRAKEMAAQRSLEFIRDGMVVGMGSGTTATHFIKLLGARVKQGLKVRGIPSSRASDELARSLGIPVIDFHSATQIDVTIDGADEVTHKLDLIKGGGGALLREKIVASASKLFVIVADSRKLVDRLGKFPLPVEVIQLAAPLVAKKLEAVGVHPAVRKTAAGEDYITDEGNLILDCACGEIDNPQKLAAEIRAMVGVVEHGLFLGMANVALIATETDVKELAR